MNSVDRYQATGLLSSGLVLAMLAGCSQLPVIATPWGKAEMAAENVEICAHHSRNLESPMPADTRANTIADMRKRMCPNTPAE